MLWLIDGYNLMHAAGAAGARDSNQEAFRRRRRGFLNRLSHALGAQRAGETVIVFDASSPPADFPLETTYKGLNLIFALGDESADARIESLIAAHSAPRRLTVVSSDRRVRRAATRRKARVLKSEEFLDLLDRLARQGVGPDARTPATAPSPTPPGREEPLSPGEAAYWLEQFGHLEGQAEARELRASRPAMLTDAEIQQIQREVDRED